MTTRSDVERVQHARWQRWEEMASSQEHNGHHILSIELLRTRDNKTVAVITAIRNHRPVKYAIEGDARGGNVRPLVLKGAPSDPCHDEQAAPPRAALAMRAGFTPVDDPADPAGIALGQPPPQQDPPPGIVALAAVTLATAFDLGEQGASK